MNVLQYGSPLFAFFFFTAGSSFLPLISISSRLDFLPSNGWLQAFHLQYLPISPFSHFFHLNLCAMMKCFCHSRSWFFYVSSGFISGVEKKSNTGVILHSGSFQKPRDTAETATKNWNVCWCKGPCIRSLVVDQIRSVIPEQRKRQKEREKNEKLACKLVHPPFLHAS